VDGGEGRADAAKRPREVMRCALEPDPGSALSDSWSGCVPWGIRSPKEMPGIFERERMRQGACSGREAPTPILDQALGRCRKPPYRTARRERSERRLVGPHRGFVARSRGRDRLAESCTYADCVRSVVHDSASNHAPRGGSGDRPSRKRSGTCVGDRATRRACGVGRPHAIGGCLGIVSSSRPSGRGHPRCDALRTRSTRGTSAAS
jgi:hypothetical protein